MEIAITLVGGLYLLLGTVVAMRSRRTDQLALRRLAPFLLTVALIAAGALLLFSGSDVLGEVVLVGAFAAYPVLLLQFAAALVADDRGLQRLAFATLLGEFAFAAGSILVQPGMEALRVDLTAFGALALASHVAVHVVLRRQVQALPSSFVRRRAVSLTSGLALLALSFSSVLLLEPIVAVPPLAAVLGGGVAVGLMMGGAAPPVWLQAVFIQPDYLELMDAERELFSAEDADEGVIRYLTAVAGVFGGDGAWVTHDGVVVAEVGTRPPGVEVPAPEDHDATRAQRLERDGEEAWVLVAATGGTVVSVLAGRDPVMYGLQTDNVLPRMADQLDVAMRARQLEVRRRAQQRAEQDAEHFRRVAELKDDLLSTINHELRTPLATVTGGLELITARWEQMDVEQQRLLVQRVQANAGDLAEVVTDVLTLVALRSGQGRLRPAAVDLVEVASSALEGLAGRDRLQLDCAAGPVVVDPDHLGRVVQHLARNALQHTDGPVEVSLDRRDSHVALRVRDRGNGFDEQLVEAFQRGGHYLHRTTRGLGLGLSLVTETVEVLGGEVEFVHETHGTTVRCRVPTGADHVELPPTDWDRVVQDAVVAGGDADRAR